MTKGYELLDTYTKDSETWFYLKHKKTGLEILYHQSKASEKGFSFSFRTPVEEQYLGTSHVLEHCVLCGSQKYNVDFWELQRFSFYTFSNASTDIYSTRYFFYSFEEKEVFKLIPILADYVFFPRLSEEAFMQEGFRVELDPKGDGRKKEIVSVVYNEMKERNPAGTVAGGCYYKLHELTNAKIKKYHKKYYRPDNCLLVYIGNASLDEVLLHLNNLLPELEAKFEAAKVLPRKTLTINELLEKAPFEQPPEHLADKDACSADYWWSSTQTNFEEEALPPKKSVQKILSEFFAGINLEEYKDKLEKLNRWQAHKTKESAYKIMSPENITKDDIELNISEEKLWEDFTRKESKIKFRDKNFPEVYTTINKDSCSLTLRASQLLSRNYYAEYALMFFLQDYISSELRKLGRIYCGIFSYKFPADFVITAYAADKPDKTIKTIKECLTRLEKHTFTETDILSIKYRIVSFVCSRNRPDFYFTDEIFTISAEELHQAVLRFSRMVTPPRHKKRTHDKTYYFTLSDLTLY